MFDFVYNNKKLVQIIMALITLPFAFWGVQSYTRTRGNAADMAASVDGARITQQEFGNALRQQQDRLRQQLGSNFDPALLDNPEMKRAVMDRLIAQQLLIERAKAVRLVVTDDQVAQIIGGVGAFQQDGKFDKKRYETVLANNNLSPLMYESRLREELLAQQMQEAYIQNGFASSQVAGNILHLNEQQRSVRVANITAQSFMAQARVDEAELKKYYDGHPQEFQVPEQARVEYVKLSAENLLAKADIAKDEIRKYYDEHQGEFGTPEERQAAHILITVNASASQAEQDAAKKKAEQLLQQVRKNPSEFSKLAKENSQDPGSASKGGDLGFFGRGMMVKPFEDSAFSLKKGEISDLVKSEFGYHIIKLIAIKPASTRSFDEVRESIASKLRQQKSADLFAELAEKFSNTVYEQSDTLKPAAALAGAKVEQSSWLSRGMPAGGIWNAQMLQAIFSDEVLKNKRNTSAIEVESNVLVAARILEYKPASTRSYTEVRETIRQKLQKQQALELAARQGRSLLEQLQSGKGKPNVVWGAVQEVTRSKHGSLDIGLVRQIFQADPSRLPLYVGAEDGQNGFVLVKVDAIKDSAAIDESKRKRYTGQLRQLTGDEIARAYLADARQHADITINLPQNTSSQP